MLRMVLLGLALAAPPDQIVFEVRHTNYAWGAVNHGFFITARGEIKRFNYFDRPNQPRFATLPDEPSHADLMKTYGAHPVTVGRVPADELAAQRRRVPAARGGALVC